MFNYIIRRIVYGVVTLIALSIIVFSLLQMSGGGPLNRLKSNPRITQEYIADIEEFYGLNEPAWVQYRIWATNYVQGEWGISFQGTQPVFEIIKSRTGATLRLMLTALFLAVMIGVPFGIYQALRQYSFFDQLGTTVSFVTFSTPIFLIAIGMQIMFAVYLERWTGVKFLYTGGMNVPGYNDLGTLARFGDTVQHLILPAVAIALISIAVYARFQRASMLEVYHSDYLRTAKAKGLPRRRVIFKHALRNALIPIVTLISLDIAALIGGAIITETIFSWPGLGRQYINAIGTLDYPMIMAIVMALGIGVVVMNLIADIAYGFLDPRVRYD
ncbi:MAG: ABC transporter permease [Acidimicrobiia bacterium]|nr:ABC transporter permease [Acidimicrobiia bacterium]